MKEIFLRSPEPVEGCLSDKRASTGSALRFLVSMFVLAVLCASSTHQPVQAQAWQCRAPQKLSRPNLVLPPRGEIRRTTVDGYILALSWSREYCKSLGPRASGRLQCNGKIGDFGFILHGLWPEARGPNYPRWCRTVGVLPRAVIRRNICMTPDVQLLQHEWAKHGSCMARKPETYFGAARLMYNAIEFPDMDRLSRRGVNAGTLAEAFADINEGLPANAVRVKTNRRGWLREMRICLGKNFMPRRCPSFVKGAAAKSEVRIWRGR